MPDTFDVVVVGAGIGGITAALACARLGRRTLLLEAGEEIGGTSVHSPVGLICTLHDRAGNPVVRGIHKELFPAGYDHSTALFDEVLTVPVYDHRDLLRAARRLLAAEPLLTAVCSAPVTDVLVVAGRIVKVHCDNGATYSGLVFVDGTADGNLSALAGAPYEKGRAEDGAMQSTTLTFEVSGIDFGKLRQPDISTWGGIRSLRRELDPYYQALRASGKTRNTRRGVLCFPSPDRQRVLFNSTAMLNVDPTIPEHIEAALAEGRKQVAELFEAIKQHPAFAKAEISHLSSKLGVREGRRILGDYVLTADDCLQARWSPDMVAACAYGLDIHDPKGLKSADMSRLADPGYYHIPYGCLCARSLSNLLVGSRCVSATHEAHSSLRVLCGVSAIGEAAGTAAAIASHRGGEIRKVLPAEIRYLLHQQGQFTEGATQPPPEWRGNAT